MSIANPSFEGLFYFGLERNLDQTLNLPAGEPGGKLDVVPSLLIVEPWYQGSRIYTLRFDSINGSPPEKDFLFTSIGGVPFKNRPLEVISFQLNLNGCFGSGNRLVATEPNNCMHYIDADVIAFNSLIGHFTRAIEALPAVPSFTYSSKIFADFEPQNN